MTQEQRNEIERQIKHGIMQSADTVRALLDEIDALRAENAACKSGEWDATDATCPAWWRGQEDGVRGACEVIQRALDGDTAGACHESLQSVREQIAALQADRARMDWLIEHPRQDFLKSITRRWFVYNPDSRGAVTYFKNPREAIDAAIGAEK